MRLLFHLLDIYRSIFEEETRPQFFKLKHEQEAHQQYVARLRESRFNILRQAIEMARVHGLQLDDRDVDLCLNHHDEGAAARVLASLEKQLPEREEVEYVKVVNPFE